MADSINDCKYIFLREIGEPEDNVLRLIVEEAKADGPIQDFEIQPGMVISGARSIESDWTCRAFELIWPTYVSYSVRNESFCALDKEEIWEGRLFCIYSKSKFLDYIARATFASADYPGHLLHYGLNCENHVIDVISTVEPEVRFINSAK